MGNDGMMASMIVHRPSSIVHRRATTHQELAIVELGAGDGTFLLEVARRVASKIGPARVMLVDQQDLVTFPTREALSALGWRVETVAADVFDWLAGRHSEVADITIANLFLHHFQGERLSTLLCEASKHTRMFVACEPYRSRWALAAASMMRAIGCNAVTVHDARLSVRAGFRERELSALWPGGRDWVLDEKRVGRFTHGFLARHGNHRG
jgi:hypothetical protein